MSEPPPPPPPPTTHSSAIITLEHHHQHRHQPQPFSIPTTTTTITAPTTSSTSLIREYRRGNWTLHETLVLITAKKLDDERRTKASTTPPDPTNPSYTNSQTQSSSCRTAELRWKWVENYCWKNGCLRSQNQCNDKWDNLLRDYKKVREYEARSTSDSNNNFPSYWNMEKHQRKEHNLPTNLVFEVFQALNEVVHRRYSAPKHLQLPSSSVPISAEPVIARPPPEQPPPPPPPPPTAQAASAETSDSSETDRSDKLDSDAKRRKVRRLGSSIMKSASMLARTLMSCEEKKEKRHKEIMELEQRRLRLEETRNEVNREGMAGLISAVNNLSGAIQAFVSDRHSGGGGGGAT